MPSPPPPMASPPPPMPRRSPTWEVSRLASSLNVTAGAFPSPGPPDTSGRRACSWCEVTASRVPPAAPSANSSSRRLGVSRSSVTPTAGAGSAQARRAAWPAVASGSTVPPPASASLASGQLGQRLVQHPGQRGPVAVAERGDQLRAGAGDPGAVPERAGGQRAGQRSAGAAGDRERGGEQVRQPADPGLRLVVRGRRGRQHPAAGRGHQLGHGQPAGQVGVLLQGQHPDRAGQQLRVGRRRSRTARRRPSGGRRRTGRRVRRRGRRPARAP